MSGACPPPRVSCVGKLLVVELLAAEGGFMLSAWVRYGRCHGWR